MYQPTLLSRTAKGKLTPLIIFSVATLPFLTGFVPKVASADTPTIALTEGKTLSLNQSSNIKLSLTPTSAYTDVIVDWEIYNSQGAKVYQTYFEHQNLEAGKSKELTLSWKPEAEGEYQVKAGIFSNNWSQLHTWIDKAATVTVSKNSVQTDSNNYESSLVIDSQVQPGKASKLSLAVTSKNSLSDVIVDLEIYNESNQKVFQKFFEHQTLESGKSVNYSVDWTPTASGTYRYALGIFSANWSGNLYWNASIQSKEQAVSPTQVAASPTPTQSQATSTAVTGDFVSSGGAYTVGKDGRIYKNGQKIRLDGVSWFGFEGGAHAPHGLWTRNWQEMIAQIKSTGFNSVRVPFCPATLKNTDVSTIEYSKNQDLQGLKSLDLLDKVLAEMNRSQLYILLDHHTPDCQAISDLWYTGGYSEQQWIEDLSFVAKRYQNLEYFMGIDIKNEPKGPATWGTGNQSTDWNTAAEKAGKAILSVNPNVLIFVQGIENNPTCSNNTYGHWWGGNLEPQKCSPISSNYIPDDKLVFTPHVYGPDVYNQGYFNTAEFPKNLTAIWDQHFGFLKSQGKAIAIGEYGGKYGAGDSKDVTWQNAITDYFASKGICDNFYWSWNPNSGDTGGILKDDWTTPWQGKLDLLSKYRNQCK